MITKYKKLSYTGIIFYLILAMIFTIFYTSNINAFAGTNTPTYGQKNSEQFGFSEYRNMYRDLADNKSDSPFTFNRDLLLKESKLRNMMANSNTRIVIYSSYTNNSNRSTITINHSNKNRVQFAGMSVTPTIKDNIIYAEIAYVMGGNSYVGIIPLKVNKDSNNDFYYSIHTYPSNHLTLFRTKTDYFGASGRTGQPVGSPAITKDNDLIFVVNQIIAKYHIRSNGKLQYEKHRNKNIDGHMDSIGQSSIYSLADNRIYNGSWNGRVYQINPNNLDVNLLNMHRFASSLPSSDINEKELLETARIVAGPTIAKNGNKRRIHFALIRHKAPRDNAGGFCSTNMKMKDVRCTLGNKYYVFNDDKSIKSRTVLNANIQVGMDNNSDWSNKHKLSFIQDRGGNFYIFDFYGKLKYKNSSFKGSMAFAEIALGEEHKYAYQKIDALRPSATNYEHYGPGVFTFSKSVDGRVIRWNVNKIIDMIHRNSNKVVVQSHYDTSSRPLANVTLSSSDGVIYSHKNWLSPTKLTGSPHILGETMIVSNSTSGNVKGGIMALNLRYNTNGHVATQTSVPIKRKIANKEKPGLLDFVKDESNSNYVHAPGMGFFAAPIPGVNTSPEYEESIVNISGDGMLILYLQNSDMIITDLSVTSHEPDGKFYSLLPNETDINPYQGNIRVTTGNKDLTIPATYSLNDTLDINVYHTVNALPTNVNNIYRCDNPTGFSSCYFTGEQKYEGKYNDVSNLKNGETSGINSYNGKYRALEKIKVKLKDIKGLKIVKNKDGEIVKYVIPPRTEIVKEQFPVYKHANSFDEEAASKHHIIAYIDFNDMIREADETNNYGYTMIEYEGIPRADLELSCAFEAPASGEYDTGVTYSGKLLIGNISTEVAVDKRFNFKIKQNGSLIDSGFVNKSDFPNGKTLEPLETLEVPFTFSFDSNGFHEIEAEINTLGDSGRVFENSYLNNECGGTFPVNVPRVPDLTAYAGDSTSPEYRVRINDSGDVIGGQDAIIRGVVKNIGTAEIDKDTQSYLKVLSPSGELFHISNNCEGIVQSEGTCNIAVKIDNNDLEVGTYQITLKADRFNGLEEVSEFNNADTWEFIVKPMDDLPDDDTFSPNNGGIKDTIGLSMPYSELNVHDYTISYEIGIFNDDNDLIKTIASNSTSYRYPHTGRNPHRVRDISYYTHNYLDSSDVRRTWNNIPKTNGEYIWNGKDDDGNIQPDGNYRIGVRYKYEVPNKVHGEEYVVNGCTYISGYDRIYYDSDGDGDNDSSYLAPNYESYNCHLHQYPYSNCTIHSSSFPPSINFGETVLLDNTLRINNAEFEKFNKENPDDVSILAGQHLKLKDGLFTNLEASEVYMEVDKELIVTTTQSGENMLGHNANYPYEVIGDKIRIQLEPETEKYSSNPIGWKNSMRDGSPGDAGYNINRNGCYDNPYCMTWRMPMTSDGNEQDAFVINPSAPDGTYEIDFVAKTKVDTPNSPARVTVLINLEDSIINHIRIKENSMTTGE